MDTRSGVTASASSGTSAAELRRGLPCPRLARHRGPDRARAGGVGLEPQALPDHRRAGTASTIRPDAADRRTPPAASGAGGESCSPAPGAARAAPADRSCTRLHAAAEPRRQRRRRPPGGRLRRSCSSTARAERARRAGVATTSRRVTGFGPGHDRVLPRQQNLRRGPTAVHAVSDLRSPVRAGVLDLHGPERLGEGTVLHLIAGDAAHERQRARRRRRRRWPDAGGVGAPPAASASCKRSTCSRSSPHAKRACRSSSTSVRPRSMRVSTRRSRGATCSTAPGTSRPISPAATAAAAIARAGDPASHHPRGRAHGNLTAPPAPDHGPDPRHQRADGCDSPARDPRPRGVRAACSSSSMARSIRRWRWTRPDDPTSPMLH